MKTFINNTIMVSIGNATMCLKGIALFILITKILGAVDFGIWNQLLVTIKLVSPFAFLGLMTALVRFLPGEKDRDSAQEVFYSIAFSITLLSIVVAFFLFIFSDLIAVNFMKDIKVSYLIKIIAFLFPTYILCDLLSAYFQAILQIKKYTFLLIGISAIELLFATLTLCLGWRLLGLVLAVMCTRLVMLFLMTPFLIKNIGFKWPNFSMLASFLAFGLPLLPVSFSGWILDSSDRYLIGYFLGPKDIGIYSASYVLGSFVLFFVIPIGTVFYPTITGLWNAGKVDELKRYLCYVIKYSLICIMPLATILMLLAKPLLIILSTKEFFSGNLIVIIIIIALVFYSITLLVEKILTVFKKTRFILLSYSMAALANLIFNIILIPKIGILGAAIATAIGYFILLILITLETLKYIRFKFDIKAVLKGFLACIFITILLLIINARNLIGIFISVSMVLACYVILLIFMKVVNKNEILFFKQLLSKTKLTL